ncbi:hypothetical protein [Pseudomarimonas salicorniae]|uniref:Secreted protein n=1 Tax=Pseudomarimonas salicorniae TaxID=2933270 RepID=A0ABT0GEC4_9GAMM|nr:hypothetical protein [Lysobacter sp. CAU 1642]MCK7592514.1 hypothetical protein [Lysobacter sp. CAU 1642]
MRTLLILLLSLSLSPGSWAGCCVPGSGDASAAESGSPTEHGGCHDEHPASDPAAAADDGVDPEAEGCSCMHCVTSAARSSEMRVAIAASPIGASDAPPQSVGQPAPGPALRPPISVLRQPTA